ncbi:MAG: hypothetical protein RQ982_01640, partial [Gammaproteobacteria bacterium]|nr:hypothetical protein [Gammaproteobacteria bacterium]
MMHSNNHPAFSKKQILADPLSLFDRLPQGSAPQHKDEEKKQLQILWQQHLALKQRQEVLQLQSKKLSRQIGEARRIAPEDKNQTIDDLKSAMQLLSQQNKTCSQQLIDIDEKILAYFNGAATDVKTDAGDAKLETPVFNYGKRNYSETIAIDEISIRQLDADPTAWNDYVKKHPAGCIHHRSEWLDLFNDSYRHPCFFFAAYDTENKVVGILPLVR